MADRSDTSRAGDLRSQAPDAPAAAPRGDRGAAFYDRLQRATAALAEVTTAPEVGELVAGELRRLAGADRGALALAVAGGVGLQPLAPASVADAAPPEGALRAAADALDGGAPLWLPDRAAITARWGRDWEPALRAAAALPLVLGGRRLGAVCFGWGAPRPLTGLSRTLLEGIARQVAVALDRAQLWERAERARQEAEQASRAKDEFLAMLGHELRNPLAPIVTALHLMKLRGDPQVDRERAVVDRQVHHLLRLVEDLLDVSRITRGKLQLERAPADLAAIVAQGLETVAPLVEQRRHLLVVDVPPGELLVEADAARLAQVVTNLVGNAAKYTPREGRIEVIGRRAGGEVLLAVRDNGMGIAPEMLPTLFDSFVQGPRSHDRAEGGLGLGLAIAQSLVAMHGGTLEARSDGPGRGSELVVRLPLARRCGEAVVEGTPRPPRPRARGLRVLVVDDNADAATTLAELLALMGCRPRVAHDGPAALVAASEQPPALVLLDLGLPIMDGCEVARRLRELPGLGRVRIVAVTGYGQAADRERTRRAGFDAHLVKPLAPERLEELVDEALALTEGAGGQPPAAGIDAR